MKFVITFIKFVLAGLGAIIGGTFGIGVLIVFVEKRWPGFYAYVERYKL